MEIGLDAFSTIIDDIYSSAKSRVREFKQAKHADAVKAQVARHVKQLATVKTVWQMERAVDIEDFYFPSVLIFRSAHGDSYRQVTSIEDLSADRTPVVIQGTQGQGKSILLRHIAIQQLKLRHDHRIPIFIELKNVRANRGIEALALTELVSMGFENDGEIGDFLFSSGNFILLLDAFDEIPKDAVADAAFELGNFVRRYPALQTVVTTRPDSDITKMAQFQDIEIAKLRRDDVEPFLLKLGSSPDFAKKLTHNIETSRTNLQHIANTPLMLTLAAIHYRSHQELPETLSEFYEQLFNVLLTRHDRTKPGLLRSRATNLNEIDLRKLFDAFCFITQRSDCRSVPESLFLEYCVSASEVTGVQCDPGALFARHREHHMPDRSRWPRLFVHPSKRSGVPFSVLRPRRVARFPPKVLFAFQGCIPPALATDRRVPVRHR